MRFYPDWLSWLGKHLSPAGQQPGEARLAERRDIVDALEAMPAALHSLPWRREEVWAAIRAGLPGRPKLYPTWQWATYASVALLFFVSFGAWWGSALTSPANPQPAYAVQPPAAAHTPLTPLAAEPAFTQKHFSSSGASSLTPLPTPVPAQTPIFSGTVSPQS
jgi:hypothetical protein